MGSKSGGSDVSSGAGVGVDVAGRGVESALKTVHTAGDSTDTDFSLSDNDDTTSTAAQTRSGTNDKPAAAAAAEQREDRHERQRLKQTLAQLEKEFSFYQRKLYQYKLDKVRASIAAVRDGTCPTLTRLVGMMRARCEERTRRAHVLHGKRLEAIRHKAHAAIASEQRDLTERREVARERVRARIMARARRLEVERLEASDLRGSFGRGGGSRQLRGGQSERGGGQSALGGGQSALGGGQSALGGGQSAASGGQSSRSGGRKVQRVREVSPPTLVLEVQEGEVEDDLAQIRANIAAAGTYTPHGCDTLHTGVTHSTQV